MPADFVFKLFMVVSMLNLMSSWLFSLVMLSGRSSPEYFAWECEAQRKSIHRRIWDPLYRLQRIEPLGGISQSGLVHTMFAGDIRLSCAVFYLAARGALHAGFENS